MRTFSSYALITVKGIGMGAADVIPGVSGGTIAFLTGIYEDCCLPERYVSSGSISTEHSSSP